MSVPTNFPVTSTPAVAATRRTATRRGLPVIAFALSLLVAPDASAQMSAAQEPARPFQKTLAVMSGLSQPILFRGVNVEAEYLTRRLVFAWSHGAGLQIDRFSSGLEAADKTEKVGLRMPWTTGPSLGYRVTNRLNVTMDLKAHRVNTTMPGGSRSSYTVYTAGPAVSYLQPIAGKWFVQPMIRWWPTVNTSLANGEVALRRADGSTYLHKPLTLGIVPNVKIGYRF